MNTRYELEKSIVLLTKVGSNLYGTNVEGSDVDYKGICIGNKDFYLGLKQNLFYLEEKNQLFKQSESCIYEQLTETDTKVLELTKIINLLIQNNPNCLDLLFSPSYIVLDKVIEPLIHNRQEFLSKRARYSYGQYAKDQLNKCNTHRKWLLELKTDPSFYVKAPNPKDYELDENILRKDRNMFLELLYVLLLDAKTFHLEREPELEQLFSKVDFKGLLIRNYFPKEANDLIAAMTKSDINYMDYLNRIKSYLNDLSKFNSFKSWKANRNKKRAELEIKCGYDSKNLSHAIRLYLMAIEIIKDNKVIVDRRITGDAEYLKAIRLGNISYSEILTAINKLEKELEDAFKLCTLPDKPNTDLISKLQVNIIEEWLNKTN